MTQGAEIDKQYRAYPCGIHTVAYGEVTYREWIMALCRVHKTDRCSVKVGMGLKTYDDTVNCN